ncbi:hypothetical protein V2G26_020661 [Clonostachys chloroleuca]
MYGSEMPKCDTRWRLSSITAHLVQRWCAVTGPVGSVASAGLATHCFPPTRRYQVKPDDPSVACSCLEHIDWILAALETVRNGAEHLDDNLHDTKDAGARRTRGRNLP